VKTSPRQANRTVSLDAEILTALRVAGQRPVAGAELVQRLGLSQSALWARIKDLRALGYDIQSGPHSGYRLVSAPDILHADDLLSRLGETRIIGRDIRVFLETTSTNDVVEKLARDGVKEGVVVFAEAQTRGRGRLGRKWLSPPGKGLWFSTLLRPRFRPDAVTRLTIASATALSRAIRECTELRTEIKWPNDILVGGKKVAGILTELSAELDTVKYIILGLGLDVNLEAADFPAELKECATSLRIETGGVLDRAALAATILRELDKDYQRVMSGDFESLADEWEAQCATIGQEIVIRMGQRRIRGRAESLDSSGALLLRTNHGHLERIIGGDVSLGR
jgi:BirA family transcriptional regulator, biotin operon repressor / biotin---[acetyl-CoA-carboxylase] ligase